MYELIELYDAQPHVKKINMEFKYASSHAGTFAT